MSYRKGHTSLHVYSCKNEAHVQIDNRWRHRVDARLHKKHCSKTIIGALKYASTLTIWKLDCLNKVHSNVALTLVVPPAVNVRCLLAGITDHTHNIQLPQAQAKVTMASQSVSR